MTDSDIREYAHGAAEALSLPADHLLQFLGRIRPGKPVCKDSILAAVDVVRDGRRDWRAAVAEHRDAKARDRVRAKGRGW